LNSFDEMALRSVYIVDRKDASCPVIIRPGVGASARDTVPSPKGSMLGRGLFFCAEVTP